MMQDILRHKGDYSLLALLCGAFIVYFISAKNDPSHIFLATVIFAALYVVWGLWHHSYTRTLTKSVVLEYLLVAIIGIVIVSSLLLA